MLLFQAGSYSPLASIDHLWVSFAFQAICWARSLGSCYQQNDICRRNPLKRVLEVTDRLGMPIWFTVKTLSYSQNCSSTQVAKLLTYPYSGGSDGIESTSDTGDQGSIPGSGRSLEKGTANHSSILAWRIPGQRRLAGYSLWDHKQLDRTEWLNAHTIRMHPIPSFGQLFPRRVLRLPGWDAHGALLGLPMGSVFSFTQCWIDHWASCDILLPFVCHSLNFFSSGTFRV